MIRYALTGETLEALSPRALVDMPEDGHSEPYPLTRSLAVDVLAALVGRLTGAELADEVQVWCFPVPMVGPPRSTRWSASFPGQAATQWLPGTDGASTWLEAVGRAAVSWANSLCPFCGAQRCGVLRVRGGCVAGHFEQPSWPDPHHLLVSRDGGPWEVSK